MLSIFVRLHGPAPGSDLFGGHSAGQHWFGYITMLRIGSHIYASSSFRLCFLHHALHTCPGKSYLLVID